MSQPSFEGFCEEWFEDCVFGAQRHSVCRTCLPLTGTDVLNCYTRDFTTRFEEEKERGRENFLRRFDWVWGWRGRERSGSFASDSHSFTPLTYFFCLLLIFSLSLFLSLSPFLSLPHPLYPWPFHSFYLLLSLPLFLSLPPPLSLSLSLSLSFNSPSPTTIFFGKKYY